MSSIPGHSQPEHTGKKPQRLRQAALLSSVLILCAAFVMIVPQTFRAHAASSGPNLSIDASTNYAINPDIYGACGISGPNSTFAKEIKLPLCRWGGDSASRYNWQVNASNSGVDFWFLGGGSSSSTPGANVDNFIDANNTNGASSLITIPVIPYIQKTNAQDCAFSIKKYGYNNVSGWGAFWFDWNGQGLNGVDGNYDCSDGVYPDGKSTYFYGNDPHDTSVENTPAIQSAWVQHLVQRYGPSSQSHIMYQLDNEPSNWGFLHRDVYQKSSLSYTDLINYSIPYAAAIKQADPTAEVIGPSDIQFAWYPDWGGTSNMVQYLQAMKQYEQQNGTRILDTFSVHYPDANDTHWPKLTDVDAVRQVVDQNYPGTKIGFDEWNFGADTDALGGALATADQLGTFARDRVSEAAYWVLDDATKPAAYSFRMYRNYDGQGSQFGDTYLQSSSVDNGQLSVYGARRSSDGALTIMVINKTANDLTSSLSLAGVNPTGNAQVYNYSNANQSAIIRQADQSVTSTGFTHTYGANSITLLAIPTNGSLSTPTPTPVPTQSTATPTPVPTQSTATPTPVPTQGTAVPTPVPSSVSINAGGSATGSFVADTNFSGGTAYTSGATIDTSGVSSPAPQAVYQSERYGNFTYTIPGLTAGASYNVQLDFAELYWNAAGQRVFNVSINGSQVLSNFDIVASAGAANKAIAKSFTATANSSGQISIQFTTVTDNAKVDGIEISPTGTTTGGSTLFASGFEGSDPQPTWTNTIDNNGYPAGGSSNITGICCGLTGPEAGPRTERSHAGGSSLMYSGSDSSTTSSYAYTQLFDLTGKNVTIGSGTTLDYWIYPQSSSSNGLVSGSNSTCVALDLIFSNGSNLRDSGATDQNGNRAHPGSQCSKLTLDTWNHVVINLGAHSNGLTVVRIDLGYDQTVNTGGYRGYVDDISIHN